MARIALGEPGQDGIPKAPADPDPEGRLVRAVHALDFVRKYFPPGVDQDFFDRAAFLLLEGLVPRRPGESLDASISVLPEARSPASRPPN